MKLYKYFCRTDVIGGEFHLLFDPSVTTSASTMFDLADENAYLFEAPGTQQLTQLEIVSHVWSSSVAHRQSLQLADLTDYKFS